MGLDPTEIPGAGGHPQPPPPLSKGLVEPGMQDGFVTEADQWRRAEPRGVAQSAHMNKAVAVTCPSIPKHKRGNRHRHWCVGILAHRHMRVWRGGGGSVPGRRQARATVIPFLPPCSLRGGLWDFLSLTGRVCSGPLTPTRGGGGGGKTKFVYLKAASHFRHLSYVSFVMHFILLLRKSSLMWEGGSVGGGLPGPQTTWREVLTL